MARSQASPNRRQFVATLAALGATSLLSNRVSAQAPPEGRRIIDVHHHFVSPGFFTALAAGGAGPAQYRDYTPDKNIADMDKAGVATAIVSAQATTGWFNEPAQAIRLARDMNEFAAGKMVGGASYKGRFGMFATLPMPDVDGTLKEIAYAYDTLKTDGVAMLTSYGNKWLGDASFAPVFDELNRRRAVLYIHPIQATCCPNMIMGVQPQTLEYVADTTRTIMSLIVSNTAMRCPDIKFIFSHAGGALISIAGRWLGEAVNGDNLSKPPEPNSRFAQLKRFYYDSAQSTSPVLIQPLKMLVPTTQFVYGSDWPFANPAAQAAALQSSGLSMDELRGLYRGNAARLIPKYT
jgi:6-methylsalicylate decarboxylase